MLGCVNFRTSQVALVLQFLTCIITCNELNFVYLLATYKIYAGMVFYVSLLHDYELFKYFKDTCQFSFI